VIAKVEPLTPARSLRGPFDYRLAGALEDVGVGSMLVVPFGRRRLLGVVVDVAAESELPPERLAEPIAALEADVPQSLVALGLWVAREYVSTPARGLALVLPPGTGTGAAGGRRPRPAHGLHPFDPAKPRAPRPDPARECGRRSEAPAHARGGRAGAKRVAHR
jgi:primosomal protein N'